MTTNPTNPAGQPEEPDEDLIGGIKVMLDAYEAGEIDRLYLAGNDFVNTMTPKISLTE